MNVTTRPVEEVALPEIVPSELGPRVLRRALTGHGALVVRGLLSRSITRMLLDEVRLAFAGAAAARSNTSHRGSSPSFVPFTTDDPRAIGPFEREYSWNLGTVHAVDAPRALARIVEALRGSGVSDVIASVFGERPAISVNKTSLRWVPPRPSSAMRRVLSLWHQDGAFLGQDIGAVNVWTALTSCGRDASSLEFVVGRPRAVVPPETLRDWSRGASPPPHLAGRPIDRPTLKAGDAVLFDHLTVHRTHISAHLTRQRYGIECWFFAPSAYPRTQMPLAF